MPNNSEAHNTRTPMSEQRQSYVGPSPMSDSVIFSYPNGREVRIVSRWAGECTWRLLNGCHGQCFCPSSREESAFESIGRQILRILAEKWCMYVGPESWWWAPKPSHEHRSTDLSLGTILDAGKRAPSLCVHVSESGNCRPKWVTFVIVAQRGDLWAIERSSVGRVEQPWGPVEWIEWSRNVGRLVLMWGPLN